MKCPQEGGHIKQDKAEDIKVGATHTSPTGINRGYREIDCLTEPENLRAEGQGKCKKCKEARKGITEAAIDKYRVLMECLYSEWKKDNWEKWQYSKFSLNSPMYAMNETSQRTNCGYSTQSTAENGMTIPHSKTSAEQEETQQ